MVSFWPQTRIGCARCGGSLGAGPAPAAPAADRVTPYGRTGGGRRAASSEDPWVAVNSDLLEDFAEPDEWDFEDNLMPARQALDRLTRGDQAEPSGAPTSGERDRASAGGTHADGGARHPITTARPPSPPSNVWAWWVVAGGLAVASCGGALTAMGLLQPAPPLWRVGLPLLLVGQFALLSIVVWHLDVVWHSHRATFVALHAVDAQIRQLRPGSAAPHARTLDDQGAMDRATEPARQRMTLAHLRAELAASSRRSDRTQDAA